MTYNSNQITYLKKFKALIKFYIVTLTNALLGYAVIFTFPSLKIVKDIFLCLYNPRVTAVR